MPDLCVATWGNLILTSVASRPTLTGIELSGNLALRFQRRYPHGYGSVAIADRRAQMPDAETRRRTSELMKRDERFMLGDAMVLEGEGFWSGSARAVMTSMQLVAGSNHPSGTFATLPEAAHWVCRHLRRTPPADAAELIRVLQDVRALHLEGAQVRPEL